MKFGYYIMSGKMRQSYDSMDDWRKAWDELGEALKEHNIELLFHGSPFGISDDAICVLKGDVADFEGLWGTGFGSKLPITDRTTTLVMV